MRAEGLDVAVLDGQQPAAAAADDAGDAQATADDGDEPASGPPPGSGPPIGEDPTYEKFFKMLKMHVPKGAVAAKMQAEGLDPAVLELDPTQPQPWKAEVPSGPPLGEDPKYAKFFKMLKMHVPKMAVAAKMAAEGLDASLLDADPTQPAPGSAPGAKKAVKKGPPPGPPKGCARAPTGKPRPVFLDVIAEAKGTWWEAQASKKTIVLAADACEDLEYSFCAPLGVFQLYRDISRIQALSFYRCLWERIVRLKSAGAFVRSRVCAYGECSLENDKGTLSSRVRTVPKDFKNRRTRWKNVPLDHERKETLHRMITGAPARKNALTAADAAAAGAVADSDVAEAALAAKKREKVTQRSLATECMGGKRAFTLNLLVGSLRVPNEELAASLSALDAPDGATLVNALPRLTTLYNMLSDAAEITAMTALVKSTPPDNLDPLSSFFVAVCGVPRVRSKTHALRSPASQLGIPLVF